MELQVVRLLKSNEQKKLGRYRIFLSAVTGTPLPSCQPTPQNWRGSIWMAQLARIENFYWLRYSLMEQTYVWFQDTTLRVILRQLWSKVTNLLFLPFAATNLCYRRTKRPSQYWQRICPRNVQCRHLGILTFS